MRVRVREILSLVGTGGVEMCGVAMKGHVQQVNYIFFLFVILLVVF